MTLVKPAPIFLAGVLFLGGITGASGASGVDARPIILVFGDSLSAGFGADTGFSFPDFLQKLIDQHGYRYRIVNQGISGDTTSGGVTRIDRGLAVKPAIVILELGGNDGLRGLPVSTMRANLETMIVRFRQTGATILLAGITLPPNYGEDYIRPFATTYHDLSVKYKLPLIPFLLEGVFEAGLLQRDGIHPTAKGNEVVAQTVFKKLEPMLQTRRAR
jgi:acyl-CoA thioesterase-1